MLKEQSTQTLLTYEDIELLIHGLVPPKKLLIDFGSCGDVSQGAAEITEVYVESISCENTENRHIHYVDEKKLFEQSSKNAKQKLKGRLSCNDTHTVSGKAIRIRAKSKTVRHTVKKLKQSKSDFCVNNSESNKSHYNTRSRRTENKTIPKKLINHFKNVESKENRCSGENQMELVPDISNLRCSYCSKEFPNKKSLRTHTRIHEKDKEFSCERCGKKFLRANELSLHIRTHTGEKPFICGSCGKSFISSSALRRHHLVHTQVTENVCHYCGKAFTQKGNLTVHLKIHSGIYDHVCKTCQKQFLTSGDLKRHERVHSREKPYMCNVCKKSFSTSSTLVCHLRSHSGERPYLCGVCGAAFVILGHLKQHNRIHARGDLWPRRKGAVTTSKSRRKKATALTNQAAVSLESGQNTEDDKKITKKSIGGHYNDASVVSNSLLFPNLSIADFAESTTQTDRNNLLRNSTISSVPGTISHIPSTRGSRYVGETREESQLIVRNYVHRSDVATSNNLTVSSMQKNGILPDTHTLLSHGDTSTLSMQYITSGSDSSSNNFIVSDGIIPITYRPLEHFAAESSLSLYQMPDFTDKSWQNTVTLDDKLSNYISLVTPRVQDVNLNSKSEQTIILPTAVEGFQYAATSLSEDKGVTPV